MRMLSVDELEPGMEVARDVVNINGAVLLAAGTLISPQHLRMFKMWGLNAIQIVGGGNERGREASLAEVDPAHREAAQSHVRHRFKHVPPNTPTLGLLQELAILRVAARLAAAPGEPRPPVTP